MTIFLSIGDHVFKIGTSLWWKKTIKKTEYVRVFFYCHIKNGVATCNIRHCFPKKNAWILNEVQFACDLQIYPSPRGESETIPIIYNRKINKPDPTCPNCHGTGWDGDGYTLVCNKCNSQKQ